ncbi:MAG: hypothetical protein ABI616_00395 [Pseudomonadota bacterium]
MTNGVHGTRILHLGKSGSRLVLALTTLLLAGALPASAAAPTATPGAPAAGIGPGALPALDRRVALLAKELDLSESQQVAMRKLLLEQREKVAHLWNETAIPAQDRIRATQLIGDQTADRIRQLLTEEQRKKYIQPRMKRPAPPADDNARSVEEWMQSTRAALPPANTPVP